MQDDDAKVTQTIQNAVQNWKSFYSSLKELADMMNTDNTAFQMSIQQALMHPNVGIDFDEVFNLPKFVTRELGIGDVH